MFTRAAERVTAFRPWTRVRTQPAIPRKSLFKETVEGHDTLLRHRQSSPDRL